ncbi:MAG: sigma-70 family RNA polymerase sigma factor, partial [Armatimonadetes bacterium]|nr:sigma-70 family RNA polymerase sigma factor [Armatimonadota bacterium]
MNEIAALVERARGGDLPAFDEIVRRFQDMAVGYAYAAVRDPHDAEDVAQEAFLAAYREIAKLDDPAAFPAWFRTVLRTQCSRHTRKHRPPLLPLDSVMGRACTNPGPQAVAEAGEVQAEVRSAIDALPDPEREVTVLYYMGGHALKEIGAFMDLPVTTVKNRLHAARKRLRERLVHMVEENLREQRPSRDGRFAAEALAKIVEEFRRQRKEDPLRADRTLLARGREQLEEQLSQEPMEPEWVRAAWGLLHETGEPEALADLMARYRSRTLPSEEEAWARWHEANLLAGAGKSEKMIALHRDLYRWARERPPGQPLRITPDSPFHPLDAAAPDSEAMPPESLFLWVMGNGTM